MSSFLIAQILLVTFCAHDMISVMRGPMDVPEQRLMIFNKGFSFIVVFGFSFIVVFGGYVVSMD
jgi:hypothetical protein